VLCADNDTGSPGNPGVTQAASVLQLRRDGLSAAEIATELGVNRSTVYRALKKAEAGATLTTGSDHG
jgi:DNA invertase Pin-like site-specific DNA recombinase